MLWFCKEHSVLGDQWQVPVHILLVAGGLLAIIEANSQPLGRSRQ